MRSGNSRALSDVSDARTTAGITVLRTIFALQTYLDSTQLSEAILSQAPNEPILSSGKQVKANVKGRVIGLHPTSQAPVAVKILSRQGSAASNTFTLAPGQFKNVSQNGFEGLEWGLPFGWLGGGMARLIIADDEGAFIGWSQSKVEVLTHRLRLKIVADANPTTTPTLAGAANWPIRFPWPNAFKYNVTTPTSPIPQVGLPLIAVEPTRILLRLRVNNLAAPASMRAILQGLDSFDLASDGVTATFTSFSSVDLQWPMASGGPSTPFPVIEVRDGLLLEGGDSAILTLTDLSNAALTNQFVDIARYGRI